MATRIFPEAACLSSGQAMAEMETAFHNHSFGKIKRKKNWRGKNSRGTVKGDHWLLSFVENNFLIKNLLMPTEQWNYVLWEQSIKKSLS